MSSAGRKRSRGGVGRPGPRRADGLPAGPSEVRAAVIAAASELFVHRGVAGVSLRDIAEAAQVNPALISRYIGSRAQLVRTVFEDLTDQLVAEIRSEPTASRGFEPDRVMNRWTLVLTHLVIVDPEAAAGIGSAVVDELAGQIQRLYGQTTDGARLRAAQLMGSAIGWRVFEPYLVASSGLSGTPIEDLRTELNRTHRRLAATPYPSPPDLPTNVD